MGIEVIPGLVLNDDQFELAAAAVAEHAPDLAPLTRDRFISPGSWGAIPDDLGRTYKYELPLVRTPKRTVILHDWVLGDRRGREEPKPHGHPWDFASYVLTGGYDEDRYELVDGAVREELGVAHRAGQINAVPRAVYHEVLEVHEPGNTLTLIVCGHGVGGDWGYLDTITGEHTPTQRDPDFSARYAALNPHLAA